MENTFKLTQKEKKIFEQAKDILMSIDEKTYKVSPSDVLYFYNDEDESDFLYTTSDFDTVFNFISDLVYFNHFSIQERGVD